MRRPHLESVEQIEQHIEDRASRRREWHRRRRLLWVLALGVLISGGIGGAVGYSTHKTQEEVLKALEEERTPASTLSKETNRALLELWRMEDVEAARGRRGR